LRVREEMGMLTRRSKYSSLVVTSRRTHEMATESFVVLLIETRGLRKKGPLWEGWKRKTQGEAVGFCSRAGRRSE
jgi:hypothetical protein